MDHRIKIVTPNCKTKSIDVSADYVAADEIFPAMTVIIIAREIRD